jgi:hypothetical protein
MAGRSRKPCVIVAANGLWKGCLEVSLLRTKRPTLLATAGLLLAALPVFAHHLFTHVLMYLNVKGERVSVNGFRARDGSSMANIGKIILDPWPRASHKAPAVETA